MNGHASTVRLVVALTTLALLSGCGAPRAAPSSSNQTPAPTDRPAQAVTTPAPAPTPTVTAAPTPTASPPVATTFSTTHPMLAVSAGSGHTCAIRTDGTLACWGDSVTAPPAGTFVAVSAGYNDCAIRTDGTLACWGRSGYSDNGHELGVPNPTGRFTAVSLGDGYACAIRTDGTVACWLQSNASSDGLTPTPVAGKFIAVTAGSWRGCGIRTDGTLACWGDEGSGLATPEGTFVAVSEGSDSTCAIRTDGTLACWGADENGDPVDVPMPTGTFSALSQAEAAACAIRTDGTLACWGTQGYDQNGNARSMATPTGMFTAVSVGYNHACAVRTDGTVACWGEDPGQAAPGPVAFVELLPRAPTATEVSLRWSATPLFVPVTSYDIRYQRIRWDRLDPEPAVTLRGTTETKGTFAVSPGYSYMFEVRAHDAEGTLSDWSSVGTVTAVDDRSLSRSTGWTELSGSRYYVSTALRSSTKGATLTMDVGCIGIEMVATTCPTCGKVRVSIERTASDDYDVAAPEPRTISLYSSKRVDRKIIPLFFDDSDPAVVGTLTIRIVTSGRPVIIDGVVIE